MRTFHFATRDCQNNVAVLLEETSPLLVMFNEGKNSRGAALDAAAAQRPVRQSVARTKLPVQKRLQAVGDRRQVSPSTARTQCGGLRSCTWGLEPGSRTEG